MVSVKGRGELSKEVKGWDYWEKKSRNYRSSDKILGFKVASNYFSEFSTSLISFIFKCLMLKVKYLHSQIKALLCVLLARPKYFLTDCLLVIALILLMLLLTLSKVILIWSPCSSFHIIIRKDLICGKI